MVMTSDPFPRRISVTFIVPPSGRLQHQYEPVGEPLQLGSLANICADADLKMGRLLDQIDDFARDHGLDTDLIEVDRPAPTVVPTPRTTLPVSEFSTVIWATGFRPSYPWLEESVLDRKGQIIHDGGVMRQPGLYALGLPFTRSRKSSFLDGVGPDARFLTSHLVAQLDGNAPPAVPCNAPDSAVRGERVLV
jgi:putative flavoprotein involved in K+ transport